jgi:multidrug efflux pump
MGITLVLTAVFILMAFAGGSVGIIYRQFCISMAVSILLSAFLALTLTPALCATLLKPHHHTSHRGSAFSAWFNGRFYALTSLYASGLGFVLKRTGRMMMLYAALCMALSRSVFVTVIIFTG